METFTYSYDPQAEISTKRRVSAFLFMVAYWTWSDFHWSSHHGSESFGYSLTFSIFSAVLFATILSVLFSMTGRSRDVSLTVTGTEIIAVTRRWWPEARRDILRKGHLRTVKESLLGLRLSERGRWGSYFLGFIWIPKSLPEYDRIKALAESWRAPT